MMKKIMIYLNCITSKCFMLMVGLALLLGVTSCNNEDFEDKVPDQPKELSKAELIEAALSRIPQTRGVAPIPVMMVTSKKTVTIRCEATEDMKINWNGETATSIIKNTYVEHTYTFSNEQLSYGIFIEGSNQAIKKLSVYNNDLNFLDVTNNINLEILDCGYNQLDQLDLTGCPKLRSIWALYNHLSTIDVTHLPDLSKLVVSFNQLTSIDVSKNPNLNYLGVAKNQITDLDLSKNTDLSIIDLDGLTINTINNLPINSTSFAAFPQLERLDVSYTPFAALDLSNNPLMTSIRIIGTAITQLDISNLEIEYLSATDSKLTNLIYTSNSLLYISNLHIDGTPFETLLSNLYPLLTALPDRNLPIRNGLVVEGDLSTKSSELIAPFLPALTRKNWVVNP